MSKRLLIFLPAGALALVTVLASCQTNKRPLNADTMTKAGLMSGSRSTPADCARRGQAVWAEADAQGAGQGAGRGECVHYFAAGLMPRNPVVVVHIHGDVGPVNIRHQELLRAPESYPPSRPQLNAFVSAFAAKMKLPFIYMGRPGTFGSSGYHGDRLRRGNREILSAALDRIREKYQIEAFAISGHSGGGTVVGELLAMRQDIRCAALSASAASLKATIFRYAGDPSSISHLVDDPFDRIDEIARDKDRTIIILGDVEDNVVHFDAQRSYGVHLRRRGHRVIEIKAKGRGGSAHGTSRQAIRAAGACANGASEAELRRLVGPTAQLRGGRATRA